MQTRDRITGTSLPTAPAGPQ